MIKCKGNNVEIKGNKFDILREYATIQNAMQMVMKELNKEDNKDEIQHIAK